MSRLKFRAWSEELKMMTDFDMEQLCCLDPEVHPCGSNFLIFLDDDNDLYRQDLSKLKIMQYLGEDCKDKNGSRYCGEDIIKDPCDITYKIIYLEDRFWLKDKYDVVMSFGDEYDFEEYEIIGNIHQNKELWK